MPTHTRNRAMCPQCENHTASEATAVHLSTDDLARRWHTTKAQLANLRSAGTSVTYLKNGSRVLYRLADILAYEAASLVTPAQAR